MTLTAQASLQISLPIREVFEGITKHEKLTQYFINESSGDLVDGVDLLWKFPEFDARFPITQVSIVENESIAFVWDPLTVVTITLTAYHEHSTIVKVTEGSKPLNDENMQWLISNVAGWSNFLASMKAYLEYDIHLRKGAYDFIKTA